MGTSPGSLPDPAILKLMFISSAGSKAVFNSDKMGKVTLCGGDYLYAGLNCFEAGQQHAAHVHANQDKFYFVLEGNGTATVGDESAAVNSGDLVFAPSGVLHSMSNPGPGRLVVMVVLGPPPKK
jgi:mannose-6-phosphate isomerase-like protein (cupin superfamily)